MSQPTSAYEENVQPIDLEELLGTDFTETEDTETEEKIFVPDDEIFKKRRKVMKADEEQIAKRTKKETRPQRGMKAERPATDIINEAEAKNISLLDLTEALYTRPIEESEVKNLIGQMSTLRKLIGCCANGCSVSILLYS